MTKPEDAEASSAVTQSAEQISLPLGFVRGEPVFDRPEDLYIPPDALEIILEAFSGPMDLLLYLIRKHKVDIVEMPILPITQQYMQYVDMMHELKLELAADYLVMAAMLAEIKSRLLLPKPPTEDVDEVDPRAELVRRLQEYEAIRDGAGKLEQLPQVSRDVWVVSAATDAQAALTQQPPTVDLIELAAAFGRVLQQAALQEHHQVSREKLSTRERMTRILDRLQAHSRLAFTELFELTEGRAGVVVSLLAILELTKEALIDIVQIDAYANLYVRLRPQTSVVEEER